ncbi:multidrug transporter [Methylorubrum sp. B1-46]|uniref:HlyD family secretion protein n=1 Tax=Methylorubrum sp. B1-46 TaxID=2897334 RepID=UPI001E5353F8|nr:multidrug transporter [Methylorubrum sp. B1-46]UGB27055.1 multidrug transporter [Methylorubrum sp. B1-46]
MSELKVSAVRWKRARKVLAGIVICALSVGGAFYFLATGRLLLDADGVITREYVSVSAPYNDSIIRQVLVHRGELVREGQKIAIVESPSISHTLANLSIQKGKIVAEISQLKSRRAVTQTLLPDAKKNRDETLAYLEQLKDAREKGLTVERSVHEMSVLHVQAAEKYLSLLSDEKAIDEQIEANRAALKEIEGTSQNLKDIYNDGILLAPAGGYVGPVVASVGEMLNGNDSEVTKIFKGPSFAVAYIPETYMFELREGEPVRVKVRGRSYTGEIEKVLPVTKALPPEFQLPNRQRERGQLVRIDLPNADEFALGQKVRVRSCLLSDCQDVAGTIREAVSAVASAARNVAAPAAAPSGSAGVGSIHRA